MFDVKPKRKVAEYSVYRVPTFARFVGTICCGYFLTCCIRWIDSWGSGLQTLIPLWIAISLASQIYYLYTDWMVISPNGIEFDVNGRYGFIDWRNIAKFTSSSIHLHSPIAITVDLRRKLLFWSTNRTSTIIDHHVFQVPTKFWGKANMEKFTQTPFGQEVLCYAPHLFDGVKVKRE